MPDYRLFTLDPFTGHFVGVEILHGADDVSVIHQVQQRQDGVPRELWREGRKVAKFDARPEIAAEGRRGRLGLMFGGREARRPDPSAGSTDPQAGRGPG